MKPASRFRTSPCPKEEFAASWWYGTDLLLKVAGFVPLRFWIVPTWRRGEAAEGRSLHDSHRWNAEFRNRGSAGVHIATSLRHDRHHHEPTREVPQVVQREWCNRTQLSERVAVSQLSSAPDRVSGAGGQLYMIQVSFSCPSRRRRSASVAPSELVGLPSQDWAMLFARGDFPRIPVPTQPQPRPRFRNLAASS